MTEWGDDVNLHWSVEEFLKSVGAPDPDGSTQASRLIEDDLGLIPRPAWYEHVEGWSRQRRKTTQGSATHLWDIAAWALPVVAGVALWLGLYWALKP
jgi:hypothetical protein